MNLQSIRIGSVSRCVWPKLNKQGITNHATPLLLIGVICQKEVERFNKKNWSAVWLLYHWLLKAVAGVVIGLIHFLRKRTRQEVKALIIQMLSFSFFTRKNSPPPHHKSATENFYFWPNFYSSILGWFWCHLDDTACSAV